MLTRTFFFQQILDALHKRVCQRVRPIFGGLVEHERPISLSTPENVVCTVYKKATCVSPKLYVLYLCVGS